MGKFGSKLRATASFSALAALGYVLAAGVKWQ